MGATIAAESREGEGPRETGRARSFVARGTAFLVWAFALSAIAMAALMLVAIGVLGYCDRSTGWAAGMRVNYVTRGLAVAIGLSAAFLMRTRLSFSALRRCMRRWKLATPGMLFVIIGVLSWDYLRCDLSALPPDHAKRVEAEWNRARCQLEDGKRTSAQLAAAIAERLEGVEWSSRGWRYRIVTLGGEGVEGQRWYPIPGGERRALPQSGQ